MADSLSGIAVVAGIKKHTAFGTFFIRLAKEKPLGFAGGIVTLLLLLNGIFADFLALYGMNATWVGDWLSPPSTKFWLGTDNVGRDILSRIIFGVRISVIVGLTASTLATFLSAVIGGGSPGISAASSTS